MSSFHANTYFSDVTAVLPERANTLNNVVEGANGMERGGGLERGLQCNLLMVLSHAHRHTHGTVLRYRDSWTLKQN